MPRVERDGVALGGLRLGQLGALSECADDAADMGWMVRDAKEVFDQGRNTPGGPDLANEAEGRRALGKLHAQLHALLDGQAGG